MAMKFREHQALAKRNTKLLILLMTIGTLVLFTEVYLVANTVYTIVYNDQNVSLPDYELDAAGNYLPVSSPDVPAPTYKPWYGWNPLVAIGSALAVFLLVGGTSYFKISQFRQGGKVVADMLGGRRVSRSTKDPCEKVLLNIVDEMAIASGVPTPPVYVLPERGINAFAAGYSPDDAVVAVTEGTFEQLSRDELQGVVAHEFSHVLSGDMRLNIRLTGLIAGILAIALVGQILFRMAWFMGAGRRSSKEEGGMRAALMAAGLALWIIGALGALFGTLIKFAICRQREYLADASAVQFTRDPDGLRGALAKIAGYDGAGHRAAKRAGEFSHFYFAEGVSGFGSMMATHPPLAERIRRVSGLSEKFGEVGSPSGATSNLTIKQMVTRKPEPAPKKKQAGKGPIPGIPAIPGMPGVSGMAGGGAATAAIGMGVLAGLGSPTGEANAAQVAKAVDHIGRPAPEHIAYARAMIEAMPESLRAQADSTVGSRALVYGLLMLDDDDPAVRKIQQATLLKRVKREELVPLSDVQKELLALPPSSRLALLDLATPTLREMTKREYTDFDAVVSELIAADGKISLYEWAVQQLLDRRVASAFRKVEDYRRDRKLIEFAAEVTTVLSLFSRIGADDEPAAVDAYAKARVHLPQSVLVGELQDAKKCSLGMISPVLAPLRRVREDERVKLVQAAAEAVLADGKVTLEEAELLRAVAAGLDCPMPPIF